MAKLAQQFINAVKGVGDLSIVPDLSVTPCRGDCDCNIFGMDIQADIQYFFVHLHMWCVGCALLGLPDRDFVSLPKHADRLLQKQPAIPMQPAHHAFFNQSRCASDLLAQIGPQP